MTKPLRAVYKTPYRNVVIPLRWDAKMSILTYSGGADSVILLYCLLENGFIPDKLVYVYMDLPGIEHKTKAVMDTITYMENKFNVDLKSRLIHRYQDDQVLARSVAYVDFAEADVIYTGTTQNPPKELITAHMPARPPTGIVNNYSKYENPFGTFDKRATVFLYTLLGINDLLELTRSCPVLIPEPCGRCFHCQERKWAIDLVDQLAVVK